MCPIPLTIANETYEYPQNRDVSGWGAEATAWAVAVTANLGSLSGPADILNTVANIANNVTTPTIVPGLSFDTATVRGARVDYNIYRVTSTAEVVEQGMIFLSYKPNASTWDMFIIGSQNANTPLSITNTGQVEYTSDNMSGINYSGSITFRAIGLT